MNKNIMHSDGWKRIVTAMTFLGTPPFYLGLCALFLPFNMSLCLVYLISVGVTELVCAVIKLLTRTDRPVPRKRESLYDQYDASTFPSAHTGRIASNVSVIFAAYPTIYSGLLGFAMILCVAYSRVALKEHYLVDVVVGCMVGIVVSFLIYYWIY